MKFGHIFLFRRKSQNQPLFHSSASMFFLVLTGLKNGVCHYATFKDQRDEKTIECLRKALQLLE